LTVDTAILEQDYGSLVNAKKQERREKEQEKRRKREGRLRDTERNP